MISDLTVKLGCDEFGLGAYCRCESTSFCITRLSLAVAP